MVDDVKAPEIDKPVKPSVNNVQAIRNPDGSLAYSRAGDINSETSPAATAAEKGSIMVKIIDEASADITRILKRSNVISLGYDQAKRDQVIAEAKKEILALSEDKDILDKAKTSFEASDIRDTFSGFVHKKHATKSSWTPDEDQAFSALEHIVFNTEKDFQMEVAKKLDENPARLQEIAKKAGITDPDEVKIIIDMEVSKQTDPKKSAYKAQYPYPDRYSINTKTIEKQDTMSDELLKTIEGGSPNKQQSASAPIDNNQPFLKMMTTQLPPATAAAAEPAAKQFDSKEEAIKALGLLRNPKFADEIFEYAGSVETLRMDPEVQEKALILHKVSEARNAYLSVLDKKYKNAETIPGKTSSDAPDEMEVGIYSRIVKVDPADKAKAEGALEDITNAHIDLKKTAVDKLKNIVPADKLSKAAKSAGLKEETYLSLIYTMNNTNIELDAKYGQTGIQKEKAKAELEDKRYPLDLEFGKVAQPQSPGYISGGVNLSTRNQDEARKLLLDDDVASDKTANKAPSLEDLLKNSEVEKLLGKDQVDALKQYYTDHKIGNEDFGNLNRQATPGNAKPAARLRFGDSDL